MQCALVTTAAAIILTALAVNTAGCGGSPAAGAPATAHRATSDKSAAVAQRKGLDRVHSRGFGLRVALVAAAWAFRHVASRADGWFSGWSATPIAWKSASYAGCRDCHPGHRRAHG